MTDFVFLTFHPDLQVLLWPEPLSHRDGEPGLITVAVCQAWLMLTWNGSFPYPRSGHEAFHPETHTRGLNGISPQGC